MTNAGVSAGLHLRHELLTAEKFLRRTLGERFCRFRQV